MLEDHKRTGAYYQAVMQNRRQFEGRVVLDVGTGSGILAAFAAKAGARKVYAVEATGMAKFARQLVQHNQVRWRGVSEVVHGASVACTLTQPGGCQVHAPAWMPGMGCQSRMAFCFRCMARTLQGRSQPCSVSGRRCNWNGEGLQTQ